jgi:hypothetical protein
LLIVSPFLAVSRSSGYGIVDPLIIGRSEDDGEHPVAARWPHDTEAPFVRLAGDWLTVAHLLHLFWYDMVASNVGNVPGIPDEAPDCEHTVL